MNFLSFCFAQLFLLMVQVIACLTHSLHCIAFAFLLQKLNGQVFQLLQRKSERKKKKGKEQREELMVGLTDLRERERDSKGKDESFLEWERQPATATTCE